MDVFSTAVRQHVTYPVNSPCVSALAGEPPKHYICLTPALAVTLGPGVMQTVASELRMSLLIPSL